MKIEETLQDGTSVIIEETSDGFKVDLQRWNGDTYLRFAFEIDAEEFLTLQTMINLLNRLV